MGMDGLVVKRRPCRCLVIHYTTCVRLSRVAIIAKRKWQVYTLRHHIFQNHLPSL